MASQSDCVPNQIDNVKLLDGINARNPYVGTLFLTATHLIFVDQSGKKECWVLHMHIGMVEKQSLTISGSPLLIRCKNFLTATFLIPRDRDCHELYTSLLMLSQPTDVNNLYAFHHKNSDLANMSEGWDFFDLPSEYKRMGLPNHMWKLSLINKNYEVCDTYPKHLFVPSSVEDSTLLGSARFRSRGRLPVLSYIHQANQATICRCSQPLAGFNARCQEDEDLLKAIRLANPSTNFMFVVDTRPRINAFANRAAGKGYENENNYPNMKFKFAPIENIHVMRSSLQKLTEVCAAKNATSSAFLSGLESCGWLKHIKVILETSVIIAKAVEEGISVLVHCSDGWDRTAQTCSLATILLDPYYRTIHGFQNVIEKEWLSFGHRFTDRCGFVSGKDSREQSPVFTQFLDCVWQLLQQFPRAFEFNERYLLLLHDHLYSCQFGTFLGNCERERSELKLSQRTYSLWNFTQKQRADFLNPFYSKQYSFEHPILEAATYPQGIQFWRSMYCRFDSGLHPREDVMEAVSVLKEHSVVLEEHAKLLEKRLHTLWHVLGHDEEHIQNSMSTLSSCESLDLSSALDFSMATSLPTIPSNKTLLNTDALIQRDLHSKDLLSTPVPLTQPPPLLTSSSEESPGPQDPRLSSVSGSVFKESDSESGFEDGSSSQLSRSASQRNSKEVDGVSVERPGEDGDHGRGGSGGVETIQPEKVMLELSSVALDWKDMRSVDNCDCAMPFEFHTKQYHCWRCGGLFCLRCIERMPLPGLDLPTPVPACKPCQKLLRRSPSSNNMGLLCQQLQKTFVHKNH